PDALAADLDNAVPCEQVDHVVPHLAVLVEAVGRLQSANAVFVVERVDPFLELGERRPGLLRDAGGGWNGDTGCIDVEMMGNDRQIAAAPVDPSLLVGAVELRIVVRCGDLPDASVERIVVLEYAALD